MFITNPKRHKYTQRLLRIASRMTLLGFLVGTLGSGSTQAGTLGKMFGVSGPKGRPYIRLYRTTSQTLSHGVTTPIQFNVVEGNRRFLGRSYSAGVYDRLYAPWTGLYLVFGNAQFTANATGTRNTQVAVDGTSPIILANYEHTPSATVTALVPVSGSIYLKKGQFVYLSAQQSSGGDLDLTSSGTTHSYTPIFELVYLGDF